MDTVLESSWKKLTLAEQMANIGNEVKRAFRFSEGSSKREAFLNKALELTSLTIRDEKNSKVVSELELSKEVLQDFMGKHVLDLNSDQINKYYYEFTLLL